MKKLVLLLFSFPILIVVGQDYPIFLFDTIIDGKRIENPHTLGFKLEREEQIHHESKEHEIAPVKIEGFNDYVGALYNFVIENLNRHRLSQKDWDRTVSISSENISPKIRRLSQKQKKILMESGKHYTKKHLDDM